MKRNFLISSILALAAASFAHANEAADSIATDTVVEVLNPNKIIITERADGGMSVEVQGSGKNRKFRYNYSTKQQKVQSDSIDELRIPFLPSLSGKKSGHNKPHAEWFTSFGMHYGFTHMSGAGSIGDMGNSVELGVLYPVSMSVVFPQSWRITTGVGFGWKNYRLNSDRRFVKTDEGTLDIAGYDPDTYSHLSRLKIFYLDVPLMLRKDFGNVAISAGAVIDFNVYGSMLTRYRQDEKEIKIAEKGINQNKVTVDLMAGVQLYDIGLYVKYNPGNVLKSGNLPEFRSLSVGFCIGL